MRIQWKLETLLVLGLWVLEYFEFSWCVFVGVSEQATLRFV